MRDDYGTYLARYPFQGSYWQLEIKASCLEEAQQRVKALCYAEIDGLQILKLPAELGLFAKAGVWLRNLVFGDQP